MIQSFGSVWDALTDSQDESDNLKARSEMMMVVVRTVEDWNVSSKATAHRLGITQARANDLLNGRISRFSLEALIDLQTKVGTLSSP